jgi:hypothetical protein
MGKIEIIANDIYMSDGEPTPRVEDLDLPLRERVELFVVGYDPEWQNPREIAERIIAMVRGTKK